MRKPHLYLVPRTEQVDDDFMEAVIEVGAQISPPPLPPRSNVVSFMAYAESLPVLVPFDDFGERMWTQ